MTQPARDKGLSLIELVVAMAIFALIAVMGVQSLSAMLRVRDNLVERDDQTTALGRSIALLRNDMTAVVPMLFFPAGRGAPQSAVREGGGVFALSVAGQPELDGTTGIHRVEWRVDAASQTLTRGVWTTLIPADRTAAQPQVPVLQGVSAMTLRSYWEGQGWVDGVRNRAEPAAPTELDEDGTGDAPEIYSDTLPLALEVTLATQNHGALVLIESLR